MTHSQAEIVRQLLIDLAQGVEPTYVGNRYTGGAWPVFSNKTPDQPDSLIVVSDTAGRVDSRDMEGQINEHHGLQVKVRAPIAGSGRAKIDAVRAAMAEAVFQRTVAVGASRYLVQCFAKFGPILPLGSEVPASNRALFTTNTTAVIRQLV